ncbi:hypothetical protein RTBOTA2_005979 [Rhodotorula toruloides]|uniref:Uncharacterized protein n=1 Tax=Rhodotorula toruloides TaxID=5286 RepID=A0A0K3CN09_RHOTO|nr:hypothetical protein RTBOTA2_005979 [Rhodotorula toruloides]PRQ70955.1 hypothetical protein AAT19DRAFT_10495 [Rhodotorula toruloides]
MSYHPQPGFQYSPSTFSSSQRQQQPTMANILNHQDSYSVSATQQQQLVGDEEYNRLLKNYKLAHLRIEEQRSAMLEQEKQNAALRKHIMLLEGGDSGGATVIGVHSAGGGGGSTVDDFTIKNSSSSLERRINRWAADTLAAHMRSAPPPPPGTDPSAFQHLALVPLAEALYQDVDNVAASPFIVGLSQMGFDYPGLGIVVQSLLRHVMSQLLCDGIVNKLLVTNSEDANQELTKLHEQLFHREPLVASVWRRQTFSAAVDSLDPEMSLSLFREHMPHVFSLINPSPTIAPELEAVLDASYVYSRMLHKSYSPGGALEGSGFYRSFVCQVGSPLDPTQLELIKKCYRTERGEPERVGACLFPGLVKETAIDTTPLPSLSIRHGPGAQNGRQPLKKRETRTLVVRRAQVICECALAAAHGVGGAVRQASGHPSASLSPQPQ